MSSWCPELGTGSALHSSSQRNVSPLGSHWSSCFCMIWMQKAFSSKLSATPAPLPCPASLCLQVFHLPNMWSITWEPTHRHRSCRTAIEQLRGFVVGRGAKISPFERLSVKIRAYESTVRRYALHSKHCRVMGSSNIPISFSASLLKNKPLMSNTIYWLVRKQRSLLQVDFPC